MSLTIGDFAAYARGLPQELSKQEADQRVVLSSDGRAAIRVGAANVSQLLRNRTIEPGTERTQAEENNRIRNELLSSILKDFGVDSFQQLPACVKKAFKVGTFKDDMKLDAAGKATSGRPLTKRRIMAILSAVWTGRLSGDKAYEPAWPQLDVKQKGCATYGLSDSARFCDKPFAKQAVEFPSVVSFFNRRNYPRAVANYFQMLVDAASVMSHPDAGRDALMSDVNDNLPEDLRCLLFGIRDLILLNYGAMRESVRKTALSSLMDRIMKEAEKVEGRVPVLLQLRNQIRDADIQGSRPEKLLPRHERLVATKRGLESIWKGNDAGPGKASLETKMANDLLRYVIDNWLEGVKA